ncbi:hypothetical protein LPB140_05775 [Sphingorhabdus lutea]|uniref:DUF4136 domain-containing protein n=2 Tax=Sphingorhabdus lutea TaxID=1913578 RepID=A0A1L3JB64_9SPHN|nr:DUF4136 domain-containing protein [Sphingorhabdus lutea]APG62384.1 hypothetical protein LPB140_05775 [Sphingorhabdus lutea]
MIKFSSIKGLASLIILTASAFTLSACASNFNANVSRFQQMPAPTGQSFAVMAADPKNEGGIEFGLYAAEVSAEMQRLGYTPIDDSSNADLIVKFDYSIDKGKERFLRSRDPFYDPYWGYGRGYSRPVVVRTRHGYRYISGYYDPFLFGSDGFGRDDSFTVFTSGIDITINNRVSGERLFEGKAEAKSRSNRLQYLVPNLVEAMFTDFPGNSGETVRISVAPEKD